MKRMFVIGMVVVFLFNLNIPIVADTASFQSDKSESDEEDVEKPKEDSLLKGFVKDHGKIWTSPFRVKGTQWLVWGGIVLATGFMIANDEAIYRNIKDYQEQNSWVDSISPFFEDVSRVYPYPIASLFLLSGWIFKDKKLVETGSLGVQAMLHSFFVVQVFKHLTGRQRPSWDEGKDAWHGPGTIFTRYEAGQWAKHDAFFSGHTVALWALASVIAHQYNSSPLVPVLSYSVATLGGLATITEDLHWISDVFLGMVVGYAIGRYVVKRRSKHWHIQPVVNDSGVGFGLTYVF